MSSNNCRPWTARTHMCFYSMHMYVYVYYALMYCTVRAHHDCWEEKVTAETKRKLFERAPISANICHDPSCEHASNST